MKYFCNKCRTEITREDRIPGKYVYECKHCERQLKRSDMITEAEMNRAQRDLEEKQNTHPCSSCDTIVPIDEMDSCGRCQRCQDEYPFDEE